MTRQTVVCDIGTGSVKSALFDGSGALVTTAVGTYEARREKSGEIDPEVWWHAFGESITALGKQRSLHEVGTIVLTGQMQNLILLDHEGKPAPAILYFDARGAGELESLFDRIPRERIVEITGNTPDGAGFPAKLLALERENPRLLARSKSLLCGAHDYVAYRLTGRCRTDRTTAGTTGLLKLAKGEWSAEILEALPIDESILPEICFAQASDGKVKEEITADLGLPPGVELLHGAGDVGASVLASQLSGGRVSCYLGTSGWVLDEAALERWGDPEQGVFNLPHPSRERVIRVAPLLTAAGAVEWYLSLLSDDEGERSRLYEEFGNAAAENPAPTGILFLPHLAGERSPFKDPDASGVFLGLRREDDRAKLFRAVLEGVSYAVRSVLESLVASREETNEILLNGGGAQIGGWPELLANVTGLPVRLAADARFAGGRGMLSLLDADGGARGPESGAAGAAGATGASGAAEAAGATTAHGPTEATRATRATKAAADSSGAGGPDERLIEPDPALQEAYEKQYVTFGKVYPQLRELMHELRTNQEGGSR